MTVEGSSAMKSFKKHLQTYDMIRLPNFDILPIGTALPLVATVM